jgi:uncharacterized membrane protein
MRRTAPLPRLASDIARSWYAIGGAAVAAVVSFVILLQTGSADDADELLRISLYLGWCTLVVIMASLTCAVYLPADPESLRSWLVATGPPPGPLAHLWWSLNGGGAIWWAISGAGVTMYTLIGLALDPSTPSPFFLTIGTAVVVSSAAMIIVSYAVHYARTDARSGGFDFPGGGPTRFFDYVYLAAQVSTTFGGSDVSLTTTRARRTLTLHSVIAMAFNTVLVALFVSVLLRAAEPA